MDAFYAAIEQRDDPSLRGKPLIVGGLGPRAVVCTASYEARPFGVRSAMPMAIARRRCPQAIVREPRMAHYAAVSAQVLEVFESFTPLVEPLSLDEAFLDVTDSRALFGDGETVAKKLKAAVCAATQLTVSVGVAPSKYVAKVASDLRKPDGLVVVAEGAELDFLAPLPVSRLWGAGPRMQEVARAHGMHTIGDVRARTGDQLVAVFGEALAQHFWHLARGLDPRVVVPDRQAHSISHETTFARDLHREDDCVGVLLQLSEGVGRRLRRAGLLGGTVRLKLRYPDFTTTMRQSKVTPTDDDLVIHRAAKALFAAHWNPARPVRLLGVGVSGLLSATQLRQGDLFAPRKSADLLRAVDAIRARFGDDKLKRGATS
jgi:DNA polymerase-4